MGVSKATHPAEAGYGSSGILVEPDPAVPLRFETDYEDYIQPTADSPGGGGA